MINKKMLKSFSSKDSNPAYTIIIENIETIEECNSDQLTFEAIQVNTNIDYIKEALDGYKPSGKDKIQPEYINKSLDIKSVLNYDKESDTFKSGLTGYSKITTNPIEHNSNDFSLHKAECVVTRLQKEITITFRSQFTHIPSLVYTMDEPTKQLYKDIKTEFTTEDGKYTGVVLTFTNLKRRMIYPEINILIIGDINDSTGTDGSN